MNMRTFCVAVAALAVLGTAVDPADARSRGNKRDPTFQLRNQGSDLVKRYPGDQALDGGAARFDGPEKGAYIERCTWSFSNPFNDTFSPTQRCIRYTIDNTQ